jgi:hypothetical protein
LTPTSETLAFDKMFSVREYPLVPVTVMGENCNTGCPVVPGTMTGENCAVMRNLP